MFTYCLCTLLPSTDIPPTEWTLIEFMNERPILYERLFLSLTKGCRTIIKLMWIQYLYLIIYSLYECYFLLYLLPSVQVISCYSATLLFWYACISCVIEQLFGGENQIFSQYVFMHQACCANPAVKGFEWTLLTANRWLWEVALATKQHKLGFGVLFVLSAPNPVNTHTHI